MQLVAWPTWRPISPRTISPISTRRRRPARHPPSGIVDAHRAPEDAELADALDHLGNPSATTLAAIVALDLVSVTFKDWLRDRKNARQIPHRMEAVGYVPVRNPHAKDGFWSLAGRRYVVYAQQTLSRRDQLEAAQRLVSLTEVTR
jgi:hypothetical protein